VDLRPWVEKELLEFRAARPTLYGLETHLATMHKLVRDVEPDVVVVDPISNLSAVGTETEVRLMLMRLIDFFKMRQITALFTGLLHGTGVIEETELGVSSLIDTWLL